MGRRQANGKRVGLKCLHDRLRHASATATTARHLADKLKGSFRRAEVRQVDRRVGVDHANQSNIGIIKAFCDDLRANQNFHLTRSEARERLINVVAVLHGVAIHSQYRASFRKRGVHMRQFFLHALRSQTKYGHAHFA